MHDCFADLDDIAIMQVTRNRKVSAIQPRTVATAQIGQTVSSGRYPPYFGMLARDVFISQHYMILLRSPNSQAITNFDTLDLLTFNLD